MMFAIILVLTKAVNIFGQFEYALHTPESDAYLLKPLVPVLHTVNLFDGPSSVSHAETSPTKNKLPTLKQMMYYNYYAAATYCPYHLKDLNCPFCDKLKKDVHEVTVEECGVHNTLALITVSHKRKEIIVAYRGTQDAWNYVLDAVFFQKEVNGCRFHLGFYIATMSLYDKVVQKVAFHHGKHPTYKIIFTCHSLGGAMLHTQPEYWVCGKKNQKFCNLCYYEDPNCSASFGPVYFAIDHSIYFDCNYAMCGLTNPASMVGLPLNLPDVAKILPPLPVPISNIIGAVGYVGFSLASPLLGR